MVALRKHRDPLRRTIIQQKRELRRERCLDEDGNEVVVIVWGSSPGLVVTSYTLEDRSPVHYEDESTFFALSTGKFLTRC